MIVRTERLERPGEELLHVAFVGLDVVTDQETSARILLTRARVGQAAVVDYAPG
jgi:hypothetical protein